MSFKMTGIVGDYSYDCFSWHRPSISDEYDMTLVPTVDKWSLLNLHSPSYSLGLYNVYPNGGEFDIDEGQGIVISLNSFAELANSNLDAGFKPFDDIFSYLICPKEEYLNLLKSLNTINSMNNSIMSMLLDEEYLIATDNDMIY